MDFEKQSRRQSLKVIISESIMVLAVIIMVVVLAFIVSGYWLNSDFEVKRQGMLQISSVPTGADVEIDGESSWLQRTNTSKVLESGEHTVKLTKEGYDSWEKTINISEGLLYRIHYPRLFLNNRSPEKLFSTAEITNATVSPDHESLLLMNKTTEWLLVKLNNEKLEPKKINVAEIFSGSSLTSDATVGILSSEILDVDWSLDGMRALFKVRSDGNLEWIILNFDNVKNSINLTKEFGVNFNAVKMLDRSANSLLVVQNNNLHRIDVPGRSISSVLAEKIFDFDYYNNEVFFSASLSEADESENKYYIGKIKLGDNKIIQLGKFISPPKLAVTEFYEDKFIFTLEENTVTVYRANDFSERASYQLGFTPETIKVGHEGEFITMHDGRTIATIDMEARAVREWSVEGENFGWVDNDMIYTVFDGELIVYDFDGFNRRVIAKNVLSHFPVAITDDRYLYYFSDSYLVREWLIPR
ncbi:PEGA domain-containing protein [Candidatus Saccharibacteria bacterium]|nr:PEGA domain-containing protein [Candidatus Saccharibacteria bacterium]